MWKIEKEANKQQANKLKLALDLAMKSHIPCQKDWFCSAITAPGSSFLLLRDSTYD